MYDLHQRYTSKYLVECLGACMKWQSEQQLHAAVAYIVHVRSSIYAEQI